MCNSLYFKGARANRLETTCGSLRIRLHKPHVAISRSHASTPQSSVVVTQLHTSAPRFSYTGGMEARVELVRSGDPTRTSCTHERTCVRAANAFTNLASQTDHIIVICMAYKSYIYTKKRANSCLNAGRNKRWVFSSSSYIRHRALQYGILWNIILTIILVTLHQVNSTLMSRFWNYSVQTMCWRNVSLLERKTQRQKNSYNKLSTCRANCQG